MRGVFSARPGIAILTFWQGAVEVTLRVNAIALGFAVVAAAAFSVHHIQCDHCKYVNSVGLLLFPGLAEILYQTIIIIGRFLNFNCINAFSKIAFVIDICINFVLALFVTIGVSIFISILQQVGETDIKWEFFASSPWSTSLAVCSFAMLFDLVLLVVWMSLFLCLKWNHNLVQYTAAVTSPDDQETLTQNIY